MPEPEGGFHRSAQRHQATARSQQARHESPQGLLVTDDVSLNDRGCLSTDHVETRIHPLALNQLNASDIGALNQRRAMQNNLTEQFSV